MFSFFLVVANALNAPFSMYDLPIAEWGKVYAKIEKRFYMNVWYMRCRFCILKTNHHFLLKYVQYYIVVTDDSAGVLKMSQSTSARQASEWGMRAV